MEKSAGVRRAYYQDPRASLPSRGEGVLTKALAMVPGAHLVKDEAIDGYGLMQIAVSVAGKSQIYCIELHGMAYPWAFPCPAH